MTPRSSKPSGAAKKATLAMVLAEVRALRDEVRRLRYEDIPTSFWGGSPIYTGLGFDRPTALDYGPFTWEMRAVPSCFDGIRRSVTRCDGSQLVATSRNTMGRWGWACGCAGGSSNGKSTQDVWCDGDGCLGVRK